MQWRPWSNYRGVAGDVVTLLSLVWQIKKKDLVDELYIRFKKYVPIEFCRDPDLENFAPTKNFRISEGETWGESYCLGHLIADYYPEFTPMIRALVNYLRMNSANLEKPENSFFLSDRHQESGSWIIYGQFQHALDNRPIAYYLVMKSGKPRKTPAGNYFSSIGEAIAAVDQRLPVGA